ncbi:YSIRK-type signal peptide-containing protein [Streptococcus macedonicus]|nr:YSIRK-type signal peptide-containing protein [Streptococcus macedonicus]MCW8644651.1 YSIRK-type signal peptide-containing protein [Streptococcus macedonicus]PHV59957.1 hypothetical protein CS005_05705 [Streptococcus macedonicus]
MKKISRLSFLEKRQFFGIRKLKVGVASVTIATALFWSASLANSVSADQISAETATELVTNQSEIAEQAIDVAQSEIDTLADTQTEVDTQIEVEKTESIVSEVNTQTAAAETDVDQAVEEVVTTENVAEVNTQTAAAETDVDQAVE